MLAYDKPATPFLLIAVVIEGFVAADNTAVGSMPLYPYSPRSIHLVGLRHILETYPYKPVQHMEGSRNPIDHVLIGDLIVCWYFTAPHNTTDGAAEVSVRDPVDQLV